MGKKEVKDTSTMPLRVFTDKLQHIKQETPYEVEIEPVDAFGGYVAVDKYKKDNLEKVQENIQWKTGLPMNFPLIEEVKK